MPRNCRKKLYDCRCAPKKIVKEMPSKERPDEGIVEQLLR